MIPVAETGKLAKAIDFLAALIMKCSAQPG